MRPVQAHAQTHAQGLRRSWPARVSTTSRQLPAPGAAAQTTEVKKTTFRHHIQQAAGPFLDPAPEPKLEPEQGHESDGTSKLLSLSQSQIQKQGQPKPKPELKPKPKPKLKPGLQLKLRRSLFATSLQRTSRRTFSNPV